MRTPKIITDTSRLSDAELDNFAQAVVAGLTGNANFTTPKPTLVALGNSITAFQDAMSAAANGGEAATAAKDAAREDLEELLHEEADYVETTADGDAAKMLSSGFKISKDPTPVGPLPKPENFKVKPVGKGEISLSCNRINGAKIYVYHYMQVGGTVWLVEYDTASRVLLTGLESGKEYIFKMLPVGTSKVRQFSDEIRSFVF